MNESLHTETDKTAKPAGGGDPAQKVPTSPEHNASTATGVPRIAVAICIYHTAILLGSLFFTTFLIEPGSLVDCVTASASNGPSTTNATTPILASTPCHIVHHYILAFSFLFGMLGSALSASRIVVLALRYRNYQTEKIAWQVLTPIHGGVLAVVGIYVVFGGLLALVRSPTLGPEFGYFVGGFSFLVGFSSELFVKRLIRATEALFGEKQEETIDAVSVKSEKEVK